jgi:hypothetical protein
VSAAPKVSPVSAKQRVADKANLVKARAAQKGKPRTARQKAASRQNLVKARAAQTARREGKKPVKAKTAQAPYSQLGLDPGRELPTESPVSLHVLPLCAAVAVAGSLYQQCGAEATRQQIWELYQRTGDGPIAGVLEAVAEHGLAGWRLSGFEPATPDRFFPGLVCGIRLGTGYHAVLAVPGGMRSWGMVLPLAGTPEEAWILDWEETCVRPAA